MPTNNVSTDNPDEPRPPGGEPNTLILADQSLARGFIQLPKLILYARNLTRDAKLLYAVLLGYAWQEDHCFPGYQRLCFDLGASENMVRKYMRELEAVGLLSQRRRGLGKTNLYTLNDLRTSKIEVQEPPKTAVQEPRQIAALEPAKSEVEIETVEEYSIEKEVTLSKRRQTSLTSDLNGEVSKFRKGSHPLFEEGNTAQPARGTAPTPVPTESERPRTTIHPAAESDVTETGMARLSQVLATHGIPPKRARGAPPATPDLDQKVAPPKAATSPRHGTTSSVSKADQDTIRTYLTQYAEEFHDQAPKFSSTMTRVLHYFETSGALLGPFTARMEAARRRTKADQSAGRIRKKGSPFAYFLSLLEEELGLREAPASFTHQVATTPSEPEPARRKSLAGKYARMVHR